MERRHGRGFNAVAKGVVGPMAAWRIAEGDWTRIWQAVVVDLFSGCSARRHWRRRRSRLALTFAEREEISRAMLSAAGGEWQCQNDPPRLIHDDHHRPRRSVLALLL